MKKVIGAIVLMSGSFILGIIASLQMPKLRSIRDVWFDAFDWGYRCRELEELSSEAAKDYYKKFKSYVKRKLKRS